MYHPNHSHRASAADGLRDYGLSGIELGHATQQRHAAAGHDRALLAAAAPARLDGVRQRLGDAIVRLGTVLAGEGADPRVGPAIRPKAGMP